VDDRIARLESSTEQLLAAVRALQQRVDALEARPVSPALVADGAGEGTGSKAASGRLARRDPYDPIVIVSLVGRLFLVLAGGFFLRAMTEAGVLPVPVGITLAFAYALIWLGLGDRAGGRGQSSSAIFHALAAAMVAFPLVVEATTRFKVMGVPGSAVVLAALSVAFLYVAWRQRLQAVAWVAVLAALPTSLVLLAKTGVIAPFALYLIALGVATLWVGYTLEWTWLRWPTALVADAVVAGMALQALSPEHRDSFRVALLMQLTLLAAYLVSIAIRTLVRSRKVIPFEVVQTAIALVVGFGGALYLTRATGAVPAMLGLVSLVLGAACYAVAFAFVDRHEDLARNAYFYTTLALVLVISGLALELQSQWLGVVFAAFGVLAAVFWARHGRLYMLLHAAAYALAAGIASHALGYSASVLAVTPGGPWAWPGAVMFLVLLGSSLAAWFASVRPDPAGGAPANVLRLSIAIVVVWVIAGCLTGAIAPAVAGRAAADIDVGALATVRTCVLAAITLLAAWVGRHPRFREWAWLVYPLLVLIGLKMVVQDFKFSRPATLFIALALYGVALIVAPRLRKSSGSLVAEPAGG
jgi:Predicted membrane protein (DUF2339)